MSFINKLLGIRGGGVGNDGTSSGRPCPVCGADLWTDAPGERYECHNTGCNEGVFYDEGGELIDPWTARERMSNARPCDWCESSLSGAEAYAPYEDGSTPYAYIICPSCGQENVR